MEINQENDVLTVEQLEKQLYIKIQTELYEYKKHVEYYAKRVLATVNRDKGKNIIKGCINIDEDYLLCSINTEVFVNDLTTYVKSKLTDTNYSLKSINIHMPYFTEYVVITIVSNDYKLEYSPFRKFLMKWGFCNLSNEESISSIN